MTTEYIPTPDEIDEACRKIREGWDPQTLLSRTAYKPPANTWTVPLLRRSSLKDTISEHNIEFNGSCTRYDT